MELSDLEKAAGDHLRFVEAGGGSLISSPPAPLWPGIYRETGPGVWEPVSHQTWNELSVADRLDLLVAQMRQISAAIDGAGFVLSVEGIGPEAAAFSADDIRKGVHSALCRVYREIKSAGSVAAVGTLASTVLLRLFFGEVPLAGEGAAAAVALVLLYGERFCGEGSRKGAR